MEGKERAEALGVGMKLEMAKGWLQSGTREPPAQPRDRGTLGYPQALPSLLHLLGPAAVPGWPRVFGRALVAP